MVEVLKNEADRLLEADSLGLSARFLGWRTQVLETLDLKCAARRLCAEVDATMPIV